jgi:hypothetical protein
MHPCQSSKHCENINSRNFPPSATATKNRVAIRTASVGAYARDNSDNSVRACLLPVKMAAKEEKPSLTRADAGAMHFSRCRCVAEQPAYDSFG